MPSIVRSSTASTSEEAAIDALMSMTTDEAANLRYESKKHTLQTFTPFKIDVEKDD
jgi:hypothetical protein